MTNQVKQTVTAATKPRQHPLPDDEQGIKRTAPRAGIAIRAQVKAGAVIQCDDCHEWCLDDPDYARCRSDCANRCVA